MTSTSKRKLGFARERDLARLLWRKGFACVRGPASGAKAKRIIYPDLVAIKNGKIFVIEVKTREKRETIYIERLKIERLVEFSKRAGGRAFLAIKYMDGSEWRFIPIEKLETTPAGNYRLTPKTVAKEGLTLSDLVSIASNTISLDEFIKTSE